MYKSRLEKLLNCILRQSGERIQKLRTIARQTFFSLFLDDDCKKYLKNK